MYFSKGTELVGRGKRKIWTKKGFLVLGKTLPHFFFFKLLSPRDLDYLENILKKKYKGLDENWATQFHYHMPSADSGHEPKLLL